MSELESLLDKGKYHEEYDCAYRDGNNGALYAFKNKLNSIKVKEVKFTDSESVFEGQYLNKDKVVTTIERLQDECEEQGDNNGVELLEKLFDKIDTIEVKEVGVDLGDPKGDKSAKCIIDTKTLDVKEVDLDFHRFAEEMETVFALPSSKTENTEQEPLNWEYAIAKHFFELGVNASNLLTWEDISVIRQITAEYRREKNHEQDNEDFCKEVLKRFKAQKGE